MMWDELKLVEYWKRNVPFNVIRKKRAEWQKLQSMKKKRGKWRRKHAQKMQKNAERNKTFKTLGETPLMPKISAWPGVDVGAWLWGS